MSESSPYEGLVNLCYQLRYEKESLSAALTARNEVVSNLEHQLLQLKNQLSDITSSQRTQLDACRSESINLQEERLHLTRKLSDLEDRYRKLETKEIQAREQADQFEEMIRSLKELKNHNQSTSTTSHALAEKDVLIKKLEATNKRLKKELSTMNVLYEKTVESKRSLEAVDDAEQPIKRHCEALQQPTYILSAADSLLREFETIIGWSIVKDQTTGAIDLVCNSNTEIVVRLVSRDGGEQLDVLVDETDDSPLSTFLQTFNSVPGYVAKKTLEELTKRIIRDVE